MAENEMKAMRGVPLRVRSMEGLDLAMLSVEATRTGHSIGEEES